MKVKYILYGIILTSVFSCSIFSNENMQTEDQNKDTTTITVIEPPTDTKEDTPDTSTTIVIKNRRTVDYETAELNLLLDKAKKEDKLILLMFGAEWCVPCKKYKEVTFKEKETNAYLKEHYLIKYLDAETDFEGLELGPVYSVSSYPTIIFIDSNENYLNYLDDFNNPKLFIVKNKKITFEKVYLPADLSELQVKIKELSEKK